jgi:hypothetical protein
VLETLLASSLWQKLRSTSEDDAFANS